MLIDHVTYECVSICNDHSVVIICNDHSVVIICNDHSVVIICNDHSVVIICNDHSVVIICLNIGNVKPSKHWTFLSTLTHNPQTTNDKLANWCC